ncbi:KGG domain-containing protein [Herbaspirillum sp.]|uniref:KGG domain-containing protein n=1 Tax=Herbaspirillum sp. TaxID=1890675 RepID=UPI000C08F620|nr:KGG domain-containing protein [Herbaspirillum sp.]MAF04407.1 general stress protein [Herbaspirillum sp.]|tara:strand:- start:35951 stop:36148 length:198 start_codon:yes stop_codon:yes gene_type:complete
MTSETQPAKRPRGFAAMSPDKRKQIASMGGRHAHALGKAHQFTQEEAREAGRKGGGSKKSRRTKA